MTPLDVPKFHYHGTISEGHQKDIIMPYRDVEMKNDYEMNTLNLVIGEARCRPQEVRLVATHRAGWDGIILLIVTVGLKYESCESGLAWLRSAYLTT
jgi:hypothetical protein